MKGYLAAVVDDFAVVIVPVCVLEDRLRRETVVRGAERQLRREVVLAAPTRSARIHFHGRSELARAAERTPLDQLRWRQITL